MRKAVAEAIHHCRHRSTFGKRLIKHDLMKNVLADLALESEAATAFAFRLAQSFDEAETNENEKLFSRIATAIGKFWICKRATSAVGEAMECLGGNGYVEESPLPRLYRDIPVNSIWEGSGNVQCLDVLRSRQKEPDSLETVFEELKTAMGANSFYDYYVQKLKRELAETANLEFRARRLVEMLALGIQASILIKNSPNYVSETFCQSRLNETGFTFGTLTALDNLENIIYRSLPEI
jgi:putative acyl-CoA dehydrogenase